MSRSRIVGHGLLFDSRVGDFHGGCFANGGWGGKVNSSEGEKS